MYRTFGPVRSGPVRSGRPAVRSVDIPSDPLLPAERSTPKCAEGSCATRGRGLDDHAVLHRPLLVHRHGGHRR
eukprot:CAMPEP_0113315050 /NCGR_PEP_ID=MMETSP0010_2-20120614/10878_1 /TAXON_ID=216773 ORGANISM="Corethron hystrix, Strain 308" /NCGR_SAMPLE_ID=MMETSP0010_2 /ASSEMBLY_ACC=CAM_ASM_000155 /LENGTH=72 /DNA_ID=CAMNT_0000171483 /DNA_START=111 /DNA_END=325 /DNA_ORIENTATION=- /assembly_acc=CAM_ASM_000155